MPVISIVGLGAGDLEQMPIGIYRKLKNSSNLFLRTREHPAAIALEDEGIPFQTFDDVYERHSNFDDTYDAIVAALIRESRSSDVVYAVPGHPLVAERTVQLLLNEQEAGDIEIEICGGQSFLDALFTAVKIDPIEGCQIVNALSMNRNELQIRNHLIITQVYDQMTASEVKLILMELLPDDYEITVVEAAGSKEESINTIPLYELDRDIGLSQLTAVFVPAVTDEELLSRDFNKLRDVIAALRGPNGCPWDKKQTHESLKKYLIEETNEVIEAIDEGDPEHLAEELGDVLLQVMLHSQIGEDEGYFSIDDVIDSITKKMIRRHPHVFGDMKAKTEAEVKEIWKKVKQEEKNKE